MTGSIVVRRVRATEGTQLRTLRLQALTDAPMAFGSMLADEQARPEQEWRERAATSAAGVDRVTFIAEHGALWVGSATSLLDESTPAERTAWVVGMWVHPDVRRRGVARALLSAVATWAGERGADVLQLHVTETNATAIGLYERLGFRASGQPQPLPHTPGVRENHMRCPLADFRG